MHIAVPIIIVIIIGVQAFFFVKNLLRMRQFSQIFSIPASWRLRKQPETELVNGVDGQGNSVFSSIVKSINKYLSHNTGSVIDFGLLKDAVDRHCDSVENDIATQTPIPLYCGLAGTMIGVIVGLGDLLSSDAILTLIGSHSEEVMQSASQTAGEGINALLSGVAWAMVASIFGILFTTINSFLFKQCKLQEESGKNSFLAWMQSELLPKVSSDYTDALINLVQNLNQFNKTFAQNTQSLGLTLENVNQSYATQADIIRTIHDMDVTKMATSNVEVLKELQACTDKLADFNRYLDEIHGYTDAIHRFEQQFQTEADRIHVLEEIRDFFRRHQSEIAKSTADADDVLRVSLANMKEAITDNVYELRIRLAEQSDAFKNTLRIEKEAFEQFVSETRTLFRGQMELMPQMASQLEEIATIPTHLNALIERIEASNTDLASRIVQSFRQQSLQTAESPASTQLISRSEGTPKWMKLTGWIAVVVIAIASTIHIVLFFLSLLY